MDNKAISEDQHSDMSTTRGIHTCELLSVGVNDISGGEVVVNKSGKRKETRQMI
jgi:hypothetical protein